MGVCVSGGQTGDYPAAAAATQAPRRKLVDATAAVE
jgi:hypothetical protein